MTKPIIKDSEYIVRRISDAEKKIKAAWYHYEHDRYSAGESLMDEACGALERATVCARKLIGRYYYPDRDLSYIRTRALEESGITCSLTPTGHLHVTMPWLMPRKRHGTTSFIAAPLYKALGDFSRQHEDLAFKDCRQIIMYVTVYGPEVAVSRYRDVDNYEVDFITDSVALFFLKDDSPRYLAEYIYWGLPGKVTKTHIVLIPEDEFFRFGPDILTELAADTTPNPTPE